MERAACSMPQSQTAPGLSGRQVHLLRLLCEGRQYEGAAESLGVSVNTVGFHVRDLYAYLGPHSK